MPTPIAHSLVSLTLSDARPEGTHLIKWATFWVILGNFADFDFLPGILLGAPGRFHHGFTHSILFAVVLSVVAYHVYPLMFRRRVSFWVFLSVTGSFSRLPHSGYRVPLRAPPLLALQPGLFSLSLFTLL